MAVAIARQVDYVRVARDPRSRRGIRRSCDGDGTFFLTDVEHAELERLVDDLWKLAAVDRELDSSSERSADRTWAIAMKRTGEVRLLEGHGWPVEVSSVFTFVNGRIDARRQRERDLVEKARQERSCDPPWSIDAAGHKHYKERCLQ